MNTIIIKTIKIESEDQLATMLALKKFLKVNIKTAKNLSRIHLGETILLDPEIEVETNLSKEQLTKELKHFYIYIN